MIRYVISILCAVFFCSNGIAQNNEILSFTLSFRDANDKTVNIYDYEITGTFWNFSERNLCYFETERENGKYYRGRNIRVEVFGFHARDFLKTSRDVWNTEIGYSYRQDGTTWLRGGVTLLWSHLGRSSKMTHIEIANKYLNMRFLKGMEKTIYDFKFKAIRRIYKKLHGNILFKYYNDSDALPIRQFKIGFGFYF